MEWQNLPPPDRDLGDRTNWESDEGQHLAQELMRYLQMGAIEVAPDQSGVISPVFLRTTQDAEGNMKRRGIFDLRYVNSFSQEKPSFRMEGLATVRQLLRKNDYMIVIDLSDAYLTMMMRGEDRRFLRFRADLPGYKPGTIFQFRTLPFGWCEAPRTFCRAIRHSLLETLRSEGFRCSAWLDDIIIMAGTKEQALQARVRAITILHELGFSISGKSQLNPSQMVLYLGFVINSTEMEITLPQAKVADYSKAAARAAKCRAELPTKQAESLLGKLQSTSAAVGHSTNAKLALLKSAIATATRTAVDQIPMTDELRQELKQWAELLHDWNGSSVIIDMTPDFTVHTDACNTGWGGMWMQQPDARVSGHWNKQTLHRHINFKELKAALYVVRTLVEHHKWRNGKILLRSDNTVTVAVVNRVKSRSQELLSLARELHSFLEQHNLQIWAEHIPGEENDEADLESRRLLTLAEAELQPRAMQQIQARWPTLSIDGLATAENAKFPKFISWKMQPGATGTDFLTCKLDCKEDYYLNPPVALIQRVLNTVRREQLTATIVVPEWPSAPWWPTLMETATQPALRLGSMEQCYDHPLAQWKKWDMIAVRLCAWPAKNPELH